MWITLTFEDSPPGIAPIGSREIRESQCNNIITIHESYFLSYLLKGWFYSFPFLLISTTICLPLRDSYKLKNFFLGGRHATVLRTVTIPPLVAQPDTEVVSKHHTMVRYIICGCMCNCLHSNAFSLHSYLV